jgi:hypothetical protein
MTLAGGYFIGGSFGPFLCFFIGAVIVLRGHFPNWFAHHIEAQIIAGIPYRRTESFWCWMVAVILAGGLASVSSLAYGKLVPQKPDISKAINEAVREGMTHRFPPISKIDEGQRHPSPEPEPPTPPPIPQPIPPRLDLGFALGAEYVLDGDNTCGHGPLVCYSESQIVGKSFNLGSHPWHTIIYRYRNRGSVVLSHPHFHVEASNVTIQVYPGHDRTLRVALYVLEIPGDDALPYSMTKSYYACPVDLVVPETVTAFDVTFGVFGENMPMRRLQVHFVAR